MVFTYFKALTTVLPLVLSTLNSSLWN